MTFKVKSSEIKESVSVSCLLVRLVVVVVVYLFICYFFKNLHVTGEG